MAPGDKIAVPPTESVQKSNGQFLNKRNKNIYCYYWSSVENPRALLLLSHGFTEHCMMYDELAKAMVRLGFFVFAHDHVGHGRSEGSRAYVEDLHYLVDDSVTHIKRVRESHPELPLFMCGHSMGGSIAVLLSLEKELQLRGVVLIAPALATNPETAPFFKIFIAKLLSKLVPQCPLSVMDFSLSCQDKNKVAEMYKDPLRCKGYVKARPVVSLIQGADEIFKKCDEIKVPFFLLHGDMDKICNVNGSTKFYEEVKSSDKTLKIYPGAYHSLLNEPNGVADDVIARTGKWLEERILIENTLF